MTCTNPPEMPHAPTLTLSPRPTSLRAFASLMAGCACLAAPASALAWDVSLNTSTSDFLVSAWNTPPGSPAPWTWTPRQIGGSTGVDVDGSIPIDFVFATWTGTVWEGIPVKSSISLPDFSATAEAGWQTDEIDAERPGDAQAYVFGSLANGESMGAQFVYDFSFTLDAQGSATISFADGYATAYLETRADDTGIGFAGLKLYANDLGLDEFGGANQPYFEDVLSLEATGQPRLVTRTLSGLSYTFENLTSTAQTYSLRLEGYALVFTPPVPEPHVHAMLLAGLGLLGVAVRRHRRMLAVSWKTSVDRHGPQCQVVLAS